MSDERDDAGNETQPFNWGIQPETPAGDSASTAPKKPWWNRKADAADEEPEADALADAALTAEQLFAGLAEPVGMSAPQFVHPAEPPQAKPELAETAAFDVVADRASEPTQSLADLVQEPVVEAAAPVAEPVVDAGEPLDHWTAPVEPVDAPEPIFGSSGSFTPAEPPAVAEAAAPATEAFFATAAVPTAATLNESGAAPRIPAGEAGFAGLGADAQKTGAARNPKLLWWVTGGMIALVVVVALFFFGTQLPKWISSNSAVAPVPSVSPTAALSPGTYAWDQLYGGECIDPFTTPWQQDFTVVDCGKGHAAQLVYRGSFGGEADAAFPGEDALGQQINALCTRNGIFDASAASAYSNLQVQGSYPVTADQWNSGQRNYYCFVSRTDGSAITASLQGSGPAS